MATMKHWSEKFKDAQEVAGRYLNPRANQTKPTLGEFIRAKITIWQTRIAYSKTPYESVSPEERERQRCRKAKRKLQRACRRRNRVAA